MGKEIKIDNIMKGSFLLPIIGITFAYIMTIILSPPVQMIVDHDSLTMLKHKYIFDRFFQIELMKRSNLPWVVSYNSIPSQVWRSLHGFKTILLCLASLFTHSNMCVRVATPFALADDIYHDFCYRKSNDVLYTEYPMFILAQYILHQMINGNLDFQSSDLQQQIAHIGKLLSEDPMSIYEI